MSRSLYLLASAVLLFTPAAIAADAPSFAAAAAKSAEKFNTPEGGQYGIAFMKSAGKTLVAAMHACDSADFAVASSQDVVFIVSASGQIEYMVRGQSSRYGDCIVGMLRSLKSVAKPPSGSWPIQVRFLHGRKPPGNPPFMVISDDAVAVAPPPPDKPLRAAGEEKIDALLKAEKPYIAKGRATYPAAKKRYLAGLPRGYTFAVRKHLSDPGGERNEEVFVYVDAITAGVIYGRIASELGAVRSFRQRQRISFPESDVLDWTIIHPDGGEEGNYVGKFIDTYKPR